MAEYPASWCPKRQRKKKSVMTVEPRMRTSSSNHSYEIFPPLRLLARAFGAHGRFCSSHPWEVIVSTLTFTLSLMSMSEGEGGLYFSPFNTTSSIARKMCAFNNSCRYPDEYNSIEVIVMSMVWCIATLYSYYQFRKLHKMGSRYVLEVAGLFVVFSSFIFTCTMINVLNSDIRDLKDSLFFFLLLIDLSKVSLMTQLALSSSCQKEVSENISHGMSIIGPSLTLDAIVEILLIGVGTLTGVRRLEVLSCYACMSVIVNYIVFMTFYPACLSLMLELTKTPDGKPCWHIIDLDQLLAKDIKPNPVVQRVKLIMSAGLMVVHARSHWYYDSHERYANKIGNYSRLNSTEPQHVYDNLLHMIAMSMEQVVILIIVLSLAIKYLFFESKDSENLLNSRRQSLMEELSRLDSESETEVPSDEMQSRPMINGSAKKAGPGRVEKGVLRQRLHKISVVIGDDSGTDYSDDVSSPESVPTEEKEVQTDSSYDVHEDEQAATKAPIVKSTPRSLKDCCTMIKSSEEASKLTDEEIMELVNAKELPAYQLEKALNHSERGVQIRRKLITRKGKLNGALKNLPYQNFDYENVNGVCCENVIGFMPVPVGVAGPLLLDGKLYHIPMATTEGCLIASTNRGCRALLGSGVRSELIADGMTRGPVMRFSSMSRASRVLKWLQVKENYDLIKSSFDSTSRFARLQKLQPRIAGRQLYVRFVATTGDAMGMNMLSKATEQALKTLHDHFPDMEVLSLSGNLCTDKKPAAINWIEGRGKSVVCEAFIPEEVVESVLKTTTSALVDLNLNKNLIGSSMAGSIGGFNAHSANIVTALFIATGQDAAQNVVSSNCITLMEAWGENQKDLYISCTMPSIEVGTIGGGTILGPQASCLEMLGCRGAHESRPGENAATLARIVCATVLAGELSLMSALAAGHLVRSHLRHNRSVLNMNQSSVDFAESVVKNSYSRDIKNSELLNPRETS